MKNGSIEIPFLPLAVLSAFSESRKAGGKKTKNKKNRKLLFSEADVR